MFVNQNVLNSGLYTNFQSHPSTSADRQVNQNSVNNNFASTMSSSLYSRLKNNFPYMPNMHNQQSFPNFNFVNGQNLDRFSESFRPQPYMHSQVPDLVHHPKVVEEANPTVVKEANPAVAKQAEKNSARPNHLTYTPEQMRILEEAFTKNKGLRKVRLTKLAKQTNLTEAQVKFWWQIRRIKEELSNNRKESIDEPTVPKNDSSRTEPLNKPNKTEHETSNETNGKRRKRRVGFSAEHIAKLEYEFQRTIYVTPLRKAQLAAELQSTERRIRTWFQNKRRRAMITRTECNTRRSTQLNSENVQPSHAQYRIDQETSGYSSSASSSIDVENVEPVQRETHSHYQNVAHKPSHLPVPAYNSNASLLIKCLLERMHSSTMNGAKL